MLIYIWLIVLMSHISCLRIPLSNFDIHAIPFSLRPYLTDKQTAAKQGYYGQKSNATAEELGVPF